MADVEGVEEHRRESEGRGSSEIFRVFYQPYFHTQARLCRMPSNVSIYVLTPVNTVKNLYLTILSHLQEMVWYQFRAAVEHSIAFGPLEDTNMLAPC